MTAIRASSLAFAHGDGRSLFEDVSFHLASGFCGLVGENGAGKTTLLKLLTKALTPTSGTLLVEPREARIAHVSQEIESASATLAFQDFAWCSTRNACRLRASLALDPVALERFATLSPGERKRWQVGAALFEDPEVLLLDEPTNHLDEDARSLLLATLARFRGVGVLVSHDRSLLDALTTSTLRLHRGRSALYAGSYGAAKITREAEERAHRDEHADRSHKAKLLQRRLDDQRRTLTAATANLSSKKQMKSAQDHDGRGSLTKGRAASAERSLGRQLGALRQKTNHAEEMRSVIVMEKTHGRSLFVDYERAPRERLFRIDRDVIRTGEREVLRDVKLEVSRDDRIAIEGKNGCGKSTLLRAWMAESSLPLGRVLFVPQETNEAEARAIVSRIAASPPELRGKALSLVAALGVDPEVLMRSKQPSPGEARKAAIAEGLAMHAWAVILDEPTNHLDVAAIERLESALVAYPGALVIATHDRALAARVTSTTWRLKEGRVEVV